LPHRRSPNDAYSGSGLPPQALGAHEPSARSPTLLTPHCRPSLLSRNLGPRPRPQHHHAAPVLHGRIPRPSSAPGVFARLYHPSSRLRLYRLPHQPPVARLTGRRVHIALRCVHPPEAGPFTSNL
jgi:hypothetical protein